MFVAHMPQIEGFRSSSSIGVLRNSILYQQFGTHDDVLDGFCHTDQLNYMVSHKIKHFDYATCLLNMETNLKGFKNQVLLKDVR